MASRSIFTRPASAPVARTAMTKPTSPPINVEMIIESMRDFFNKRPMSVLLGTFREQDTDGSGILGLAEFTRALRSLNLDLSDAQMAAVFTELDADGSGELELKEFLNELKREPDPRAARWLRLGVGHQYVPPNREPPSTVGVRPQPWASGFNRGNREMITPAPSKVVGGPPKLRQASTKQAQVSLQLLRDFFGRRRVSALLTLFQDYDVDNSGVLEKPEFCNALRGLNLHISRADMEALFNLFDQDGSGVVEVREILSELRAEPDPTEARWQQVGIGKQYLAPSSEPFVDGIKPSTGQSGFSRSELGNPLAWGSTSRPPRGRPASALVRGPYGSSGSAPASIFR